MGLPRRASGHDVQICSLQILNAPSSAIVICASGIHLAAFKANLEIHSVYSVLRISVTTLTTVLYSFIQK